MWTYGTFSYLVVSRNMSQAFDCGYIYDRNAANNVGTWDDTDCFALHGYICKTQANIKHNAPPKPPRCDDIPEIAEYKFTKFNGGCYKYQSARKTWQEAEASCQQMGGSHLASINDAMEQAFVFTRNQKTAWTGLSNKQVN